MVERIDIGQPKCECYTVVILRSEIECIHGSNKMPDSRLGEQYRLDANQPHQRFHAKVRVGIVREPSHCAMDGWKGAQMAALKNDTSMLPLHSK
jgi:hypothetical protein